MNPSPINLIALCLLLTTISCQDCNDTEMIFISEYSLGKQDDLNRTFIKIAEKTPSLNPVSWKPEATTYYIENMKPTFHYMDSKQKAFIDGNDTIAISGGRLEVTLDFSWRKSSGSPASGTGKAIGLSQEIIYVKTLKIKDNFIVEDLFGYENITFGDEGFKIMRIDPASTPKDDISNLEKLLNKIPSVTTASNQLEQEIDKIFFYYLNQSLNADKTHIDDHFDYEWHNKATGMRANISYGVNGTFIDIEKAGITSFYIAKIKDYADWKCEYFGPRLPFSPAIYGGRQEFITFDIYKNTLRYGIEKKMLDTELKRQLWESRFFQFYAGDLYEVIPKVAKNFLAMDEVIGSCRTSPSGLEIIKGTHEHVNVSLNYDCELSIQRSKVADFRVMLGLMVHGRASKDSIDFHVTHFNQTTKFTTYQDYVVENLELADHMVTHSLNRLLQEKVFGSGWKILPRDYPHFVVQDNYTVIYDSTHVDPEEHLLSSQVI